ncbi:restriction endonuclease subunit S [Campylobacter fetus]|uniref:restriction endonuclease subunit S n=1 Tax=Campylobacter fetus TaxID=196 RepID=UPI0009B7ABC3|nr:restriction endonuclease subunit S [Campylobacter fetus]EAK0834701.1 restriction endonuclease subunit S [Campylobacter fetus]KAA3684161.1 restriction endonuclease subunit S [Campylobacter fetus subsp. fetus]KAA3684956.1 restriction endonuclease subunit S [Campylobacter fetus subsp. venerealis]KAA3687388.1 restriction endonuclease subunit S [Campylobacter fetus subsp. fetus]MBC3781430.1 restriction endonuclease subunit S [Campylobacter fetus subsp. fetus]
MPLPPLKEQQKIAEVLSACDDEINLLKDKLSNLKLQKQGLMQNLLTGKVRVRV